MRGIKKIAAIFSGISPVWRGVVIAGLVLSLWAGIFINEGSETYETDRVSVGSVISTITSVGTLKHFEEAEIHSAISGTVTEVLKNQGDTVAKDEPVIRLDATVLKSRYEKTRAEFETKESDFKYQSELYDKQLTSTNDYNKAKIDMEQAKAEFSEAEKRLKASEILSPVDGTVVYRSVEVGRSVDNRGGMLMKIAGTSDRMRLLVRVSEADIGRISEGQKVHFTVPAFKKRSFDGEIISVPGIPLKKTGAVTYEVFALVENTDRTLKAGMTADVVVKTSQVDGVVRIPTAALRFLPSDGSAHAVGSAVWVKSPAGGLKRVPVTVGESNELYAEVKEGKLSEGDDVVIGVVSGRDGESSGVMSLPQPKRF